MATANQTKEQLQQRINELEKQNVEILASISAATTVNKDALIAIAEQMYIQYIKRMTTVYEWTLLPYMSDADVAQQRAFAKDEHARYYGACNLIVKAFGMESKYPLGIDSFATSLACDLQYLGKRELSDEVKKIFADFRTCEHKTMRLRECEHFNFLDEIVTCKECTTVQCAQCHIYAKIMEASDVESELKRRIKSGKACGEDCPSAKTYSIGCENCPNKPKTMTDN